MAVRVAIGSAGSRGGITEGVQEECFEATEGNNPSENCHVVYLHNCWADFNEILIQYSWGLVDVFGTQQCHFLPPGGTISIMTQQWYHLYL